MMDSLPAPTPVDCLKVRHKHQILLVDRLPIDLRLGTSHVQLNVRQSSEKTADGHHTVDSRLPQYVLDLSCLAMVQIDCI